MCWFFFIDFAIPTTLLIHQGVPNDGAKLTPRKNARNILICMSLFSGLILGLLYKDKLISSLVAKEYEKPIDTIQDLLESGLTLFYPAKTGYSRALAEDSRVEIQQVMKNQASGFPFFAQEKKKFFFFSVCQHV